MVDRQLSVRYVPLDSLRPYARNARTHSNAQLAKLAASLQEFGWTVPMAVAGSEMIAGHGRLAAAITLRDEGKLIPGLADPRLGPVIDLSHLSPQQRRAYVVADNRLALDAGWDLELLAAELEGLKLDGFNLGLTGFDLPELDRMFGGRGGQTDPDAIPAPGPAVVSQRGEVWSLGPHRLMCGDSTSARDLGTLMQGQQAALCFTSPPYGQQRDYQGGIPEWDGLMRGVFGKLPVAADAQVLVNLGLIHRDSEWVPYWEGWIAWMRHAGWRRFGWYVWDQGFGLPGDWNGRLAPSHEFIFHFNRSGNATRPHKTKAKHPENVGRVRHVRGILRDRTGTKLGITSPNSTAQPSKIGDSVIRVTRHMGGLGKAGDHPAVFPVALAAELLTAFSDPGDLAFEPFCGSGSLIIAAEQASRVCYGMEIAPEYVDVAVRRWQEFTGQVAVHEASGATYAELRDERVGATPEEPPLAVETAAAG